MSYAGNAKLSQEIQNRILNTFQQTIALVEEGNVQEALLGCDFILRLDPLFEPARKLQGRLQESGTDVSVEDLAAFAASPLDAELPPLGDDVEEAPRLLLSISRPRRKTSRFQTWTRRSSLLRPSSCPRPSPSSSPSVSSARSSSWQRRTKRLWRAIRI